MKTLDEAITALFEKHPDGRKDQGRKGYPINWRALEARADFMDGLPPEMRSLATREVEEVIDLCESPIEQVALYQIAGHNFGNAEYPVRCRVLRARGLIEYYPDRIHLIPQVAFGRYRVDLLIDIGGDRLFAIECDGKEFHKDKERDERRDRILYEEYKVHVLRAPGGEIWRDNTIIAALADVTKVIGGLSL